MTASAAPGGVRSTGYIYEVLERNQERVIGYHWHPDPTGHFPSFEHFHIGHQFAHPNLPTDLNARASALVRAHLPTERVSLAAVLRLAITEFGVEPLEPNWRQVLDETEESLKA